MSFLEKLKKDIENDVINEVTVGTSVATFVGRGGQEFDGLFAGGFHPDFGDLKGLLQKQLDDRIDKIDFSDENTPDELNVWELDFDNLEMLFDKYEEDKPKLKNNKKFITQDNKMQSVDMNLKYDKVTKTENEKFVNPTNDWKYIVDTNIGVTNEID